MRLGMRRQAMASLLVIVAVGYGVLIAAVVTDAAGVAGVPTFEISRFTIDGGGVMNSSGGAFELSGTIGQPDAGALSGPGGLTLTGGFWFGQSPGDSNEDGGINLFDYRDLEACTSGPEGGLPDPSCAFFDMDDDQDVDLADVGEFQRVFSGF